MSRGRILVIEGEPSVADALMLILDDSGYEAIATSTGFDGLERARRGRFDLTIADVRLPDISGFEVMVTLLREDTSSSVMLITSLYTDEVVAQALSLGASDVLAIPFSPTALLERAATILPRLT